MAGKIPKTIPVKVETKTANITAIGEITKAQSYPAYCAPRYIKYEIRY